MHHHEEHQSQADEHETAEHEVNPADDPGPRGNEEVDPERLERAREDLERTLPG